MSHAANPNVAGIDLLIQTESPSTIQVRDLTTHGIIGRSKKVGAELAEIFGGTARYVSGHKCRGGWAIDNVDPAKVAEAMPGQVITVYLYGENVGTTPVPAWLAEHGIAHKVYGSQDGWMNREVA